MKNFLLEIGTEEIPARFLKDIFLDLKAKAEKLLGSSSLEYKTIMSDGTPRRLVLYIEGLPLKQKDIEKEVKGPPKSVAFDAAGTPTKAAQGFAKTNGIEVSDLAVKKIESGEYVFASVKQAGKKTEDILSDICIKLIPSLYLPVSMKWGEGEANFVRPIHYICAVFGSRTVKFSYQGISSSNKTKGHRVLSDNKTLTIEVPVDIEVYEKHLFKAGVILRSQKRKDIIAGAIEKYENTTKENVIKDEELLEEASNIVENPVVVTGKFNQQFIIVMPQDVITTVVRQQQKCFPVKDSGTFLIVSDGIDTKYVPQGYEQVVNARLNDAKFFYDEDIKNKFEDNLEKLKKVTYLGKLGSMYDKTNRIIELSKFITNDLLSKKELLEIVERAALLSKLDIVTHMVGEFSSLAGIMGREYSLVFGEDVRVCRAIYEHYLPRYSGDSLPQEMAGCIIGLGDRVDSIVGCFSAGIIPSGSQDPYGLRRSAQGIVSIIIGKNLRFSLKKLIEKTSSIYGISDNETIEKTMSFIRLRLKGLLESEGIRYDLADSVCETADDLVDGYCKVFTINKYVAEKWLEGIVFSADRITRLAAAAKSSNVDQALFIEDGEKQIYKVYMQVKDIYFEHLNSAQYDKALQTLAQLTAPVEEFFTKILIMHEDQGVRANRLALLKTLDALYRSFADFQKIVM